MPTTIKDIANSLGISYATVSRALNDKYGVNRETRTRVLEAARQLNYRPNAAARDLVTRRTGSIGLILPEIQNPFFPEIASGIERTAADLGYTVFLCITGWSPDRQAEYIRTLAEKRVEGLIIAPIEQSSEQVAALTAGEFPVVYVSDTQAGVDSSYVAIDNFQGGYIAAAHLIESGFRPVYYFGAPQDRLTNAERLAGYRQALLDHHIEPRPEWVRQGDYHTLTGYGLTRDLLESGKIPRGVFTVNDTFALGVLQGIREAGLRVPEDVAIVGFDDIPMAAYPEIQLTTVAQPKFEMGKLAVEILHEQVRNPGSSQPRQILLPPRLIVRRTSQRVLPGRL